jgi:hypothetical protein
MTRSTLIFLAHFQNCGLKCICSYHGIMLIFSLVTDEMKVTLQYFDGRPLSGSVPPRVTCTVVEAQPNTKGLTAQPQ